MQAAEEPGRDDRREGRSQRNEKDIHGEPDLKLTHSKDQHITDDEIRQPPDHVDQG